MCSIYRYKLKIQSLSAVIKEVRTKIAIGLWVLLCHCRNFCEQCIEDLDYLKLAVPNKPGLLLPSPSEPGEWGSVPSAGSSIACQRNSQNEWRSNIAALARCLTAVWFHFNWSYLFYFWCLSSLSFKSQLFSPWKLCWKGDSILVGTVSLATFGHLYVNLSLAVTLTARKWLAEWLGSPAASPSAHAVPTWAVVLHPGLLLSTLVWAAPWNNLCLTMCCSGISETSWSGTLSEHAETPFYLGE